MDRQLDSLSAALDLLVRGFIHTVERYHAVSAERFIATQINSHVSNCTIIHMLTTDVLGCCRISAVKTWLQR